MFNKVSKMQYECSCPVYTQCVLLMLRCRTRVNCKAYIGNRLQEHD